MGEDRRRIQRQVGIPALFDTWRNSTTIHGPETVQDQRMREDLAMLMSRQHGSLLNRPFRRAVRRSSFLRDLELMYEDLKSQVPLARPENDGNPRVRGSSTDWGRISVSIRVNNPSNFFDFTYRRAGWRIGSSPTRLKLGFERQLSDKLSLSLRTRYHYDENDLDMWGDVHYRFDRDTSFHLMSGNKIDVTTGAAMLPVIQSPVVLRTGEASPGFMFYVEHMF